MKDLCLKSSVRSDY